MSGDVQPRKRKDKRRKHGLDRKSEGELSFSRQSSFQDEDESSHGVHITKMGTDDVHLHVQHDHGTGGHWCAKVLFFSLLTVLLGLVALIILENRGLSDLDTPLSESRFSNYFHGWVDENREDHDHDVNHASAEDHDHDVDDDDDEHDDEEPFEEVEDQSEIDQNEEDEDGDDEDEDEDGGGEDEDAPTAESAGADDDDVEESIEPIYTRSTQQTSRVISDDDNLDEDDDDVLNSLDNDDDNDEPVESEDNNVDEDDEDDDEAMESLDKNDDDEDDEEPIKGAGDDDDNDDNIDEDDDEEDHEAVQSVEKSVDNKKPSAGNSEDDNNDTLDEDDDDDGTFESVKKVVDNDAEELLLLRARQQEAENTANGQAAEQKNGDEDTDADSGRQSWVASLAVNIGVGVALAIVARLVLIRKNPATNEAQPNQEILMKRRLTIASSEEPIGDDDEEPPLLDDEEELEEEIEYIEEEEIEIEIDENGEEIPVSGNYVPETFEQLQAMYRPSNGLSSYVEQPSRLEVRDLKSTQTIPTIQKNASVNKMAATFVAPPPPPLVEARINHSPIPTTRDAKKGVGNAQVANVSNRPAEVTQPDVSSSNLENRKVSFTHDMDYEGETYEPDIEYDESDPESESYGNESGSGSNISDVDDTELMNRLEAKYGRLPAREYESDEDPDDPTWTQINPKERRSGGPQSHEHETEPDSFEEELRRANAEMMREQYHAALSAFSSLAEKHPDKPELFLGMGKALDRLSEQKRSNVLLREAIDAFKRYLAFDQLVTNQTEFRTIAELCIERMRFMGLFAQAVPIHHQLIERYPDEPRPRNQLVVTYLMMHRFSSAKPVLQDILRRWPTDGFAQVHYGFVLKQHDQDYKNAVIYLKHGIASQAEGTQDGRFYFTLGDALQRLSRNDEAMEIYRRGAELKLFPSAYQRSLYNVPGLKAQPFWSKKETGYEKFLGKLEANWQAIRDEGLSLLSRDGYFIDETENLRDSGDWKQFELYARGRRNSNNCQKAPITCGIVESFKAASECQRGQVKFSVMHPGTHVWPHCGPTNCRLRAHLGLVVPSGASLRVADEENTWTEGKFIVFDDSFEHEVWHNGSSFRLVLIVDMWHPELTAIQRKSLSPI